MYLSVKMPTVCQPNPWGTWMHPRSPRGYTLTGVFHIQVPLFRDYRKAVTNEPMKGCEFRPVCKLGRMNFSYKWGGLKAFQSSR